MAKFPAEVATTASTLLLMLGIATSAFAQSAGAENVPPIPKDPLEKRLHSEIVCTCGCRRALDNCGMPNCGGHAAQSEKIRQLMAEGKDHDAIIAAFVRDFGGQDILIEPKSEGFNRLAWLFPYAVGGLGAIAGVFMVRKWSRRPPEPQEAVQRLGLHRPTIRGCRRASIASSKISISPLPPTPSTSDTLRPWQFFTLGALVCATVAVFIIRGTSAENLIFVCLGIFAAALVGLAALNALRPLVTGEIRQPEMIGSRRALRSSVRKICCFAQSKSSSSITRWARCRRRILRRWAAVFARGRFGSCSNWTAAAAVIAS